MKTKHNKLMTLTASGLSLFLMLGLTSCADNDSDTDDNGMENTEMTEDNTVTTNGNYFADWDANTDGYLDADEYSGGNFRSWDTNADNKLDENEWNTGARNNGYEGQSWADWDIDRDGFLNDGEYRTGYNNAGWYNAWDTDGDSRLSQEEYDTGMANRPNQ
ncbi:hypothetical protein [Persicitalea jodogahamensis]|uniref:Uncharacterized protein n=1 Tax=Persicitalea jodogahamensis TaxID=402147 RepID=A0A8J3D6X8_9BACT|nr:hypothetical protein [Persicitalea jodogahamensis]GHB61974.1 hypothetical protein GCM10007390_14850 [Persicitalea jodogahamensis]